MQFVVFINDSNICDDSRQSNVWFFVRKRPAISLSEIRAKCWEKGSLVERSDRRKGEAVHLLACKVWELLFLERRAPDGEEIRLS